MEQSERQPKEQSDLEYNIIQVFNLGAGLALLVTGHWLGLFNGAIGTVGLFVGAYARRRDRKRTAR